MPNPFFYGGHITHPAQFVGRRAELQAIFSALETAHTGQLQSVSVTGERRIGKSSLLYHVMQTYRQHLSQPDAYRVVYVDLQAAQCHTRAGLLGHLLSQLSIPPPRSLDLASFQTALEQWRTEQGSSPYLVACLDEFEQLTKRPDEFPDAFFDAWRSLAGNGLLTFVTASRVSLRDLSHAGKLTSPFFNIFHPLPLHELSEVEALNFERLGRESDRPFTSAECDWLREQGARHPCKLQMAGQLLYEAKGEPPVDLKAVRRQFNEQVAYVFDAAPAPRVALSSAGLWRAWQQLLAIPKGLGGWVLQVILRIESSKYTETTAIITFWFVFIFGLIALIYIRWENILGLWLRLREIPMPTPKP